MQDARGGNREGIDQLADRLEVDLGMLELCWSEVPEDERASVIGRIGLSAPGIARLLCPQYRRFGPPERVRAGGLS